MSLQPGQLVLLQGGLKPLRKLTEELAREGIEAQVMAPEGGDPNA